jgi:hypothetical protein
MSKRDDYFTILSAYNNFLLKEGYADTNIISEVPTAIDRFYEENKKLFK